MTSGAVDTRVSDAELRTAIEATFAREGRPVTIRAMRRQPSAYATSFPLEEITVKADGIDVLRLVLKNISPHLVPQVTRRAKPPFVLNPRREIEVYRRLLSPLHIGPRLFGFHSDAESGSYWLLTEQIRGRELYQVGERSCWESAARWLAMVHHTLAETARDDTDPVIPLIDYNRDWYACWMDRARQFAQSPAERQAAEWLSPRYDRIVDALLSHPATLVHGEFYASNVLVAETDGATNIYAVDWEMAGRGPAVLDLAALTLGDWSDEDRRAMIGAYVGAYSPGRETIVSEMVDAVACAQISLAVQWAGWFGRRRAPEAHRRNWLRDAVERAETLRV